MKKDMCKRITAGVLAACLMLMAAACNGEKDPSESVLSSGSSSAVGSDASGSFESSSEDGQQESAVNSDGASSTASSSGTGHTGSTGKTSTTTSSKADSKPVVNQTKVFEVESYGAKGDGKTNDGAAISKAVAAASADSSAKKIVRFKANKTYRVTSVPASNDNNRLFNLQYAENVHIEGNNTKLLMKSPVRLGVVSESTNCSISGLIFDYSPKPFVLGKVTGKGSNYIDFSTTEEITIPSNWMPPSTFYAFRNKENERLHFFSTGYTKLGSKKYRLHIQPGSTGQPSQAVIGEEFILPVPGSSHGDGGGSAFSINKNNGFQMSNIKIYSLPEFGFDIRCNEGPMSFTNISFRPEPGSKIHLVCWRDGFHVKDNSAKIVWDKCDIGPIGDDAFNLSSVCMKPTMINVTKDTFELTPMEGEGAYSGRPSLKVGDEFVAYDNFSGELIGEGKITKLLSTNPVTFQSSVKLPEVDNNTYFCFYSYANPNYVVKNSTIEGTVRVRCPGTFENCKFNIYWLKVENETYFEGPIPKNITFKGCTFQSLSGKGTNIVQIGTRYKNNVSAPAKYKCKNIVFQACKWLGGTSYSAEPGNEVIEK